MFVTIRQREIDLTKSKRERTIPVGDDWCRRGNVVAGEKNVVGKG